MPAPNVFSLAAQWWRLLGRVLHIEGHVRVDHRDGETWISVEDEIPHLLKRGVKPTRYRITSKPLFLPPSAFPSRVIRQAIAHDAAKDRGRALFCKDLRTGQVLAAVSFHIDDLRTAPVVLCDVALRQDAPEMNAWSLFAVHMLLAYLLTVAGKDKRPPHVGFLARNEEEREAAKRLGFTQCPRHKSVGGAGTYMCFVRRT